MIDADLKAWVLELNHNPSLDIYFSSEYMSGKKMTDDDICPVDFHVKSKVISDTLHLVGKKLSTIASIDTFNSLSHIHPKEDGAQPLNHILQQLRQLFYKLTPIKEKRFITSGAYEKLHKLPLFSKL